MFTKNQFTGDVPDWQEFCFWDLSVPASFPFCLFSFWCWLLSPQKQLKLFFCGEHSKFVLLPSLGFVSLVWLHLVLDQCDLGNTFILFYVLALMPCASLALLVLSFSIGISCVALVGTSKAQVQPQASLTFLWSIEFLCPFLEIGWWIRCSVVGYCWLA
jgi:hypothetical protein